LQKVVSPILLQVVIRSRDALAARKTVANDRSAFETCRSPDHVQNKPATGKRPTA